MIRLTLEQGHSLGAMLLVTALAFLLTAAFYRRTFGQLRRARWVSLLALRWASITVVVLLLFRPVVHAYRDLKERRSIVFAIDTSASMSIADDASGRTRLALATHRVADWLAKLEGDFFLHIVEFSDRSRVLEGPGQLPTLTADGKATSLTRGMAAALGVSVEGKPVPRDAIEAIVLLSDGIHNTSRRPDEDALKIGVPVHTVGIGSSLKNDVTYRDIQVTGLSCADTLMLNNKARLRASVQAFGMPGAVAHIVLEEDGKTLEEREITLSSDRSQDIDFEFRPQTVGRHVYTVRIPPLPEEKIAENNQRSHIALVVEPGIRVLYLEGTLRQEYGAISERFLSRDPDLQYCSLVQTRPNVFLRRSNMEDVPFDVIPSDQEAFDRFDVFILGDLDISHLRPEQQAMIVQRVRQGAGLIMLGGYRSLGPGGYDGSVLGDILPVVPGPRDIGQITETFLPQLTPDGSNSPIFANIAVFFPTTTGDAKVAGLPPLSGCTRVAGARPGATILATYPLERTATGREMPVLATQPVDQGRAIVFTGDTTRVWQQVPTALEQESPFTRFWGQLVRFAAGRAEEVVQEAGVSASTDKAYYEPDESIVVTATVRDEQGQAAARADVRAEVQGPAGRVDQIELSAVPGVNGHYRANYTPETPGEYAIEVSAEVGATTHKAERVVVEVGRANMEFDVLDLQDALLGRIAANSGGQYYHISTADHLIDQFRRGDHQRRVYRETSLAPPLPLWIVFVLLLTVEWVMRRRFLLR